MILKTDIVIQASVIPPNGSGSGPTPLEQIGPLVPMRLFLELQESRRNAEPNVWPIWKREPEKEKDA